MRHRLIADKPAEEWNEAFPIGNGFLGAMVFGGISGEHLQINEDSVWSGGPMRRVNPDAATYLGRIRSLLRDGQLQEAERLASLALFPTSADMRHYEPLGDVWIDLPGMDETDGTDQDYRRCLDIDDAVGEVWFGDPDERAGEGGERQTTVRREFLASNPDDVIGYRIESSRALDLRVRLSRMDVDNPLAWRCDGCERIGDDTLHLHGRNGGEEGLGYELVVRIQSEDGRIGAIGANLVVRDATAVTVWVTGRTTFRTEDPLAWCLGRLNAAAALGYSEVRRRHVRDYRALYRRSGMAFPAPLETGEEPIAATARRLSDMRAGKTDVGLLETYFSFGRYLLISSSRVGSLPANLQGIWNRDYEPAWGSKYTLNINTEMNYWMAEKANLADLHMPLLDHVRSMHANGRAVARDMYHVEGFVAHHNTDIWGDCAPQDHVMSATPWPLGGAWLCLHVLEHYRYGRDREFLARYFDVVRDAVRFLMNVMVPDASGHWVVSPSISPENDYVRKDGQTGSLCEGSALDTQIIRRLFSQYLAVAEDLGCGAESGDALSVAVRCRLEQLPPIGIDADERIMEWLESYAERDPGHRHFSPLFALYPGDEIRTDKNASLARAAKRFLDRRMEHGSGATGWSRAWSILLYARLHDGEAAWNGLNHLLADSTLDNLLDNHPPFQIDGNFGAVAAVMEMLVQDYEDEVLLLPALPAALAEGNIWGVRLLAGAELDMSWSGGVVERLRLKARRDCSMRIQLPSVGWNHVDIPVGREWLFSGDIK